MMIMVITGSKVSHLTYHFTMAGEDVGGIGGGFGGGAF
jgi:hypothetical protein